jgi:hypothetical protein
VDSLKVIICQWSLEVIGYPDIISHLIHKVLIKLYKGLFSNIHTYHLPSRRRFFLHSKKESGRSLSPVKVEPSKTKSKRARFTLGVKLIRGWATLFSLKGEETSRLSPE